MGHRFVRFMGALVGYLFIAAFVLLSLYVVLRLIGAVWGLLA